jgi:DNA-binding beta-propeller fold protein YncE
MSNNKDFKIKNGIKPTVYQETLGTVVSVTEGYTLSSASYDSVSFSVSGQDTSPKEVFFKSDGNKMYVLGGAGGDVNEYNLSTAWDIATASYLQNFTVSGQESNPEGVFFKPDGTKMYITGGSGDDINEYNLSTAWDVTTASYNQNFSVSDGDPKQVFFKPDGNKMFIVGAGSGVGTVYEYALSTSWDISTASYTQSFSVSTQDTTPESFFFAPDGNKMFVMGAANDIVYQYSLSTAWDLSTASYTQGFGVSTQEGGPKGVL